MQLWPFYAIIASLLWSFVNISDQYLVSKYSTGERGSGGLVLFSSMVGLLIALFLGIYTDGVSTISSLDKSLLLLSGGLSIFWIILYLYTLEIEDVSSIVPWFLTVPIFSYLFGGLFLGETLTYNQKIGSLIIFFGLILLNLNFSTITKFSFKLRPAVYMLCASVIIAFQGVLFKYIAVEDNFWVSSFWQYLGLGISGALLFTFVSKYREEFVIMNKEGGKQILLLNISSELVSVLGNLLSSFATLLAPVSLVYILGSFQPAFVLILSLLGTIFFPRIVKEDISSKIIIPKGIAILIMVIGSWVLFS